MMALMQLISECWESSAYSKKYHVIKTYSYLIISGCLHFHFTELYCELSSELTVTVLDSRVSETGGRNTAVLSPMRHGHKSWSDHVRPRG